MSMEGLYTDHAAWWPLLTPADTYVDEGRTYTAWLTEILGARPRTLLELGSGGGHLAMHIPSDIDVVLVDLSEPMLEVSRGLNPTKTHLCADMRTVRLPQPVDAVLIHDAIMYMTTRKDVLATLQTAYDNLVPGGALVLIPDVVKDTFFERAVTGGNADEDKAIQILEWHWDPDPTDDTFLVEFSYLLREGTTVRNVYEQHCMGLFSFDAWCVMLAEVGFEVVPRPPEWMVDFGGEVFWARRPNS